MSILLMALAGGAGAIARFMLDGLIRSRIGGRIPMGTMVINVSGSILLGFLTGVVLFHAVPPNLQLILGTGFCGGYTTFSTASVETARLVREHQFVAALTNGFGMLVLAVAGAAAGMGLAWLV